MREEPDIATHEPDGNEGGRAQVSDGAAGLWGELWPVLSFLVVYNVMRRFPEGDGWFTPDRALYWATGILMIGMSYEVGKRLLRQEKISPLLLMSTGMVVIFGFLGIVFGKGFFFHKPTVINLTFAAIIFGGMMTGRNLWKIMFEGLFSLPDFAWKRLATCWGIYFIAMAGWNEILVATVSEDVWANWKLGNLVIGLVFAVSLVPYTMKHTITDPAEDPAG